MADVMDQEADGRVVAAAQRVARCAAACGMTLAVAESCTGGRIAAALTSLPGSSEFFTGGVVSYANAAKVALLGVPDGLLETHGAVSEAVARAMAEGMRRVLGADLAVATTGIAGPAGGSPEKPVGTVWFARASATGTEAVCHRFAGDRDGVQAQAALTALELLAEAMT